MVMWHENQKEEGVDSGENGDQQIEGDSGRNPNEGDSLAQKGNKPE